ncbi:MAG: hypothetical protein HFG38_03820 [Eubacterium sp.]|nr:hypothetical protein [Eubacterium sp.]
MKITTDYIVGNTAIQIVNTGKRIKVIDIAKERKKRYFLEVIVVTLAASIVFLGCCFYIVKLHNTSTMLDKQNYVLRSEIEGLQKENAIRERERENVMVDYKALYKKARRLGMRFPAEGQVYRYDVEKSTAVRIRADRTGS